jgi:hypothetical protein
MPTDKRIGARASSVYPLASAAMHLRAPDTRAALGQRVLRVYDPYRHIVEIGEAMESVVRRLQGQGMLLGQICETTGMPEAFVVQAMVSHDTGARQRTFKKETHP